MLFDLWRLLTLLYLLFSVLSGIETEGHKTRIVRVGLYSGDRQGEIFSSKGSSNIIYKVGAKS